MPVLRFVGKQHEEVKTIAAQVYEMLDENGVSRSSFNLRGAVSKLVETALAMLAVEQDRLYPRLMKDDRPEIRELAKTCIEEGTGLRSRVEAYDQRWSNFSAIAGSPGDFVADTKEVLDVLSRHVERSGNEVFPALR